MDSQRQKLNINQNICTSHLYIFVFMLTVWCIVGVTNEQDVGLQQITGVPNNGTQQMMLPVSPKRIYMETDKSKSVKKDLKVTPEELTEKVVVISEKTLMELQSKAESQQQSQIAVETVIETKTDTLSTNESVVIERNYWDDWTHLLGIVLGVMGCILCVVCVIHSIISSNSISEDYFYGESHADCEEIMTFPLLRNQDCDEDIARRKTSRRQLRIL